MITVSSCGLKLQEVLSGLDKTLGIYTHIFVAFLNIHSLIHYYSTQGVILDQKDTSIMAPSIKESQLGRKQQHRQEKNQLKANCIYS